MAVVFTLTDKSVCLCVQSQQKQVNVIVQGSAVQPTATLCCCITVVTVQELCKDYNLVYRRRSNTEILSTQRPRYDAFTLQAMLSIQPQCTTTQ